MKLNKKIDIIREEINNEIKPLNTKYILDNAQITPKVESINKNKFFNLRFTTALITLLFLGILIPIALNPGKNDNINDDNSDQEETDKEPLAESNDKVYSFVATSAVSLVYSSSDIFSDSDLFVNSTNNLLVIDELSSLNRFLSTIEIMLSFNNNYFYRQASDKSSYANKIVYDGVGLLEEDLYYEIYYNETLINSTNIEIDCIVVLEDKTINLIGKKQIIDSSTILQMTYYINEDNNKDYVQVSKNFNDNNDSYEYMIVKEDNIVGKSKLTLIQDGEPYAKLENKLLKNQLTTFNIYSKNTNMYSVEYSITPQPPLTGDVAEQPESKQESGNITIDINDTASSYYVSSNNSSDVVIFGKVN